MTLEHEDLDAIRQLFAETVAELLPAVSSPAAELVDARTVADRIGMSAACVREHGSELGGVRIGGGIKPRWRFDIQTAVQSQERAPVPALPSMAQPRRRRPQTDPRLLPIRP